MNEEQKNDKWMLGEDIPNCDLFFSTLWLRCFVTDFAKNTGRAYSKIMCRYEGYHLWFYFGEQDSFEVGKNIVNRIVNEKGYAKKINKNIIKQADILRKFSEKIPQTNLNKLSKTELWDIYDTHQQIHSEYYTWCWIPVAADMFHNNLTNRVKKYLRDLGVAEDKLNEYFIILTQPTKKSLIFIEQQELLRIGQKIEKDRNEIEKLRNLEIIEIKHKLNKNLLKLIEKHKNRYYYTKHLWVEGEYTVEDYLKQLQDIFKCEESYAEIIKKQNLGLKNALKKKKALMKELNLNKQWRNIFENFGDFMVTKIYRRYAQILAIHHMSPILREIAKRMFITEKQVRFMLPHEVKTMLLENKYNEAELLERSKNCIYYSDLNTNEVYVGEEAKTLISQIDTKDYTDIIELRGEIGCPGYGRGKVKIIIRAEDMKKMNEGDVLVSIATDPDIVPAMKKATAIITEQGGVTSHAAIVSRELNIPCVIGTKIATRVLHDGDEVEVDANHGVIKIIK